jgi:23S rRNA (adenine-N6)-dimethyltransferase
VKAAGVHTGDLVIDIGAGTGTITPALVDAGARVIAVELHPGRVIGLRQRFDGASVTVVKADASDLRLPRRPFRVVANPPFAITTGLLRRLTAPGSRLVRGDLVVPVFMADRWAHGHAPGAGRWRSTYAATVTARVPSRCFRPSGPPAAVLTIEGTGRDR